MSIKTDKEIIEAIRLSTDEKAIAAFYKDGMHVVVKYTGKFGGRKEEASDIFQYALMNFYSNVVNRNFKEEKYKIHGYFFNVSKNLSINRVQKVKRMMVMENEDMQFVVSDAKSILDSMLRAGRDAL